MKTKKLKCEFITEMIDDLKINHGLDIDEEYEIEKLKNKFNYMLHYEYKTTDKREIELIREQTEIDFDDGGHFVYSISKKQLRKFKLGAIDGIMEYVRMKKIIFNSEVVRNVERILQLKLSKKLSKSIDNHILENVRTLGKEK